MTEPTESVAAALAVLPEVDPARWRGETFGDPSGFAITLDAAQREALRGAVAERRARGADPLGSNATDWRLGPLEACLERAVAAVRTGPGFVLLRGLPVDDDLDAFVAATWALGTRFGHTLSQNAAGEHVSAVVDASNEEATPRMYRSNLELRLHTDVTAMIALACWQPAASGGVSVLASARALHDVLLRRDPALLEPLYRGFHYHRLGEQAPDEAPVTPWRVPVFSVRGGVLSCRYQRAGIAAGHRDAGVPLTDAEIAALDAFDDVARDERIRLAFPMMRGDLLVVNNYAVLHARSRFTEFDEPERRRRLVRLWLDAPGFRDVTPHIHLFAGNGVPPQPGRTCTYDFKKLYADDPRASGGVPDMRVGDRVQSDRVLAAAPQETR